MAEIRIPTDRIPADILQRLQAIGHAIIFPGGGGNVTTAAAAASLQPLPPSSLSSSSTSLPPSTLLSSSSSAAGATVPNGVSATTTTTMVSADTLATLSGPSPAHELGTSPHSSSVTPSTSSSVSSFPSTSSSPPLLLPFASPESSARPTTTAVHPQAQYSPHHRKHTPSHSDETDGQEVIDDQGQESIVHVLDLNMHRKRSGHPLDESGIVRIFPMEEEGGGGEAQEEPDNIQAVNARQSEIVRIFPDVGEDERCGNVGREPAMTPRVHATPTKTLFSSPRQRHRQHRHASVSTNCSNNSINNSSSNNNNNNNISSSINLDSGSSSSSRTDDQKNLYHQRVPATPQSSGSSTGSIVPHILSKPAVFSLEEPDDQIEDADEVDGYCVSSNIISVAATTASSSTNSSSYSNRVVTAAASTPKRTHANANPSFGSRLTPPVSGATRRSPGGLVTPPMTPDDIEDDEVFSYDLPKDDLLLSNRRVFDAYRQTIECTPHRGSPSPSKLPFSTQRRHSDFNHAHPAHLALRDNPGSAPSPFSPAQRLSELSFGDRQHTRKRLSFEDCEGERKPSLSGTDVHIRSSVQCLAASPAASVLPFSNLRQSAAALRGDLHSEPALSHKHYQSFPRDNDGAANDTVNDSTLDERSHSSIAEGGLTPSPFLPDKLQSQQYKMSPQSQNYRPRPSKSVSPSLPSRCPDSYSSAINNNNNNNSSNSRFPKNSLNATRPHSSMRSSPSPKSHGTDFSLAHTNIQQQSENVSQHPSLHSHAHFQSRAPPPSPSEPISSRHVDSSARGVLDPMTHERRSPPRARLHSEGDGVTFGPAPSSRDTGLSNGRPRCQTFSQGKRRRLDTPKSEDADQFVGAQTGVQLQLPPPSPQQQQQQHGQSLSVSSQQQQQHHLQPHHHNQQQPQQHQYQHPPREQTSSAPQQQQTTTSPCACATIERDFLQVAEYAYKRIRHLDNTPGDFDRFRREMAQTNDMLREWLVIMGNIRNICGHSPSASLQPPATSFAPTSFPTSSSSSTASSSSSSSFSVPPVMSSSSGLPPPPSRSQTFSSAPHHLPPPSSSPYSVSAALPQSTLSVSSATGLASPFSPAIFSSDSAVARTRTPAPGVEGESGSAEHVASETRSMFGSSLLM